MRFKWDLFSSPFTWWYLFFSIFQIEIWNFCWSLTLDHSGRKSLNFSLSHTRVMTSYNLWDCLAVQSYHFSLICISFLTVPQCCTLVLKKYNLFSFPAYVVITIRGQAVRGATGLKEQGLAQDPPLLAGMWNKPCWNKKLRRNMLLVYYR